MFVKICGVTTEEDALLAVALGADALGFIFAAGSKRLVSPARVADIVKRLPSDTLTIGVFRDELPARILEIVRETGLVGAQMHGGRADLIEQVATQVRFAIRAMTAGDPAIDRDAPHRVHALHLDAATPGGGQPFDWSLAENVPHRRFLLAGGLDPANVAEAIARVRPWGVDVASGTEAAPGRKDPLKLRAFIANAKAAGGVSADEFEPDGDRPFDWQEDL